MAAGSEVGNSTAPAAAHTLRVAAEGLLLFLVAFSPWPFGCRVPRWEFILSLGILSFALLWAAHAIVTRRFSYRSDPISLCLLGLILLTAFQLVPLPPAVVGVLSPTALEWHRNLIPEAPELLPGEAEAAVPRRSQWVPLTVAPSRTEDLLAQFLAVFIVYAGARNFVAGDRSFRRLAWVGFGTGLALALLGISQFLAGPRLQFITPPPGAVAPFGPFVNKNHFAFQVLPLAGLTIGLFLAAARREGVASPPALGLLAGLGLMVGAVAFSQSRGGVVAAAAAALLTAGVAWWARRGRSDSGLAGAGLILAAGAGLVAAGLVATFGGKVVSERIATIWGGGIDDRVTSWRGVRPLIEAFPVFGVGAGGLARAEPVVRTDPTLRVESNTMDNEYLEAAVEGGLIRFALTVGLALAAVGAAAVGYRQRRSESVGPLLLGCVFGLGAVAIHSAGDFGLHNPSVALAAAVISAQVVAARSRVPRRPTDTAPQSRRESSFTGWEAHLAAGAVVFAALAVVLADWRVYRVDRLRSAATVVAVLDPRSIDVTIGYLEAATRVRPDDPAVWNDLYAAHLAAAANRWQAAGGAVAGPVAFAAKEPPRGTDPGGHMTAALRAARTARDLQPLSPGPHLVLGAYADRFARSEPATAHLARAKAVAGFDAEVWFISGQVMADRGDWAAAATDWRQSLVRSSRRLGPIVLEAATHMTPERIRAEVLPDDPAVWYAATPFLYPDLADPARKAWIQVATDRWAADPEPETLTGLTGWATALEELGATDAALRVWRRAVERFPDQIDPRDRLAARLEAEEDYEQAVPVLEWLTDRKPDHSGFAERLAAARHALKLKADIDRP